MTAPGIGMMSSSEITAFINQNNLIFVQGTPHIHDIQVMHDWSLKPTISEQDSGPRDQRPKGD